MCSDTAWRYKIGGTIWIIELQEAHVAREMSHIEKYTRGLEREVDALKRAQCLDMEDPDVRVEFWKAETRAARATVYVCMAKVRFLGSGLFILQEVVLLMDNT